MIDKLSYIISGILEDFEKIKIEEAQEDGILNLTIISPKENIGKIIGKEGKIIKAIRNVMKIPAIKQGKRINITLSEMA